MGLTPPNPSTSLSKVRLRSLGAPYVPKAGGTADSFGGVVGRAGTIFDVSHKQEVYGPGKSYNIFAGKDGSKGLGMSSLKPEDAVPDYSGLSKDDMKVLDDWHGFFAYVHRPSIYLSAPGMSYA